MRNYQYYYTHPIIEILQKDLQNNSTCIAIHQPNLFPRLKILQKLAYADIWCVLDTVQYCPREWQNRTQIIPEHGNSCPFWLTVPINRPYGRNSKINEVSIADIEYLSKILEKTLLHAFRLTPYWNEIADLITNLKPHLRTDNLTNLCVEITSYLLQVANRKPKIIYASDLPVNGKSSELIADLCCYLNQGIYLADSGAKNYLKPNYFNGIEVLWQNWREPSEKWDNIISWRNISSLNYLSRFGPDIFSKHLLDAEFKRNLIWEHSSSINSFKS